MEEKLATLNLSQKEIDSARQIYRKAQTGRPKGFIIWLLMALVWIGLLVLVTSVGEISGGEDATGILTAFFGIPAAISFLLFLSGNGRSKKKYKKWCAQVSEMNPVLIELFKQELVEEKEKQRLEDIAWKKKNEEEFREGMKEVGQDMKKLGKMIAEDIKESIEDAYYKD